MYTCYFLLRAYEELEKEGFIDTVHGKGSYVAAQNKELLHEKRLQIVEEKLSEAAIAGKSIHLSDKLLAWANEKPLLLNKYLLLYRLCPIITFTLELFLDIFILFFPTFGNTNNYSCLYRKAYLQNLWRNRKNS